MVTKFVMKAKADVGLRKKCPGLHRTNKTDVHVSTWACWKGIIIKTALVGLAMKSLYTKFKLFCDSRV